ncbi:hypothetical protein [Streptomyces boninensis]|uniref:hypothetical protein n=1 Tax=Streptomyces boninensis TaxID=2039455 RepID=UPI003B218C3E
MSIASLAPLSNSPEPLRLSAKSPEIQGSGTEKGVKTVVNPDTGKPSQRWTSPEKWQVGIGLVALLVAIIACMGQFLL